MNYNDALEYIYSNKWKNQKPGLRRMEELCSLLDNPQDKTPSIHIAGSNGKGSVASMINDVLENADYKVGLFISPVIFDFRERIKINKEPISKKNIINLVKKIKKAIKQMNSTPTEYEIITAMAFLFFAEENCDFMIIETGIGGTLDSTNIIKSPLASVFTPISLDHQDILGNTLDNIAIEKSGIIKNNSSAFSIFQESKVEEILKTKAKEINTDINFINKNHIKIMITDTNGSVFKYKNIKYKLNLLGDYQINNAVLAIEIIQFLRKTYKINNKDIKNALRNIVFLGRFQKISENPMIIFDGAHNKEAAINLKKNLKNYFKNQKIIFITSILVDKDGSEIYEIMAPLGEAFYTFKANDERAASSKDIANLIKKYTDVEVSAFKNAKKALDFALKNGNDKIYCIFGSLSTLGDILKYFDLKY